MLTADYVDFSGTGLGGTSAVENLQRALVDLSTTGWPAVNPGDVTGEVNDTTLAAVVNVLGYLPGVPSYAQSALSSAAAVLAGAAFASVGAVKAASDALKALIAQYASVLTMATQVLATKRRTASGAPPPPPPAPGADTPPPADTPPATVTNPFRRSFVSTVKSVKSGVPTGYNPGPKTIDVVANQEQIDRYNKQKDGGSVSSLFDIFKVKAGTPWYKNWHYLAGIGGGVVVAAVVARKVLR